MNRLFAVLLLSALGGGIAFSPPSAVKSVHTQAISSQRPLAFLSYPKSSPKSRRVLLNFTPKDDNEVSDDTPFIKPALHNSNFFRAISILYALLFAVYTSSKPEATANALSKLGKHLVLSSKAAAAVHMLSFGTWFGTVFYTTFVAGITMFKNLPRRTFGTLQSKLFPLYFKLCTGMIALQVNATLSLYNVIIITKCLGVL